MVILKAAAIQRQLLKTVFSRQSMQTQMHYYSSSASVAKGSFNSDDAVVKKAKNKPGKPDLDNMTPQELAKHYGYDPEAPYFFPQASWWRWMAFFYFCGMTLYEKKRMRKW